MGLQMTGALQCINQSTRLEGVFDDNFLISH